MAPPSSWATLLYVFKIFGWIIDFHGQDHHVNHLIWMNFDACYLSASLDAFVVVEVSP